MKSSNIGSTFLSVFVLVLTQFPTVAFAAGGEQNSTETPSSAMVPPVEVIRTPESSSNTSSSVNTLQPVRTITNLTPLQNSYSYSSSQQYSSSGYNNPQCGFSVGSSVSNSNTAFQAAYTVDMRYSSAPCADPKYQADIEKKKIQIQAQSSDIQSCMTLRTNLALAGKNPDIACPPVNSNRFQAVK